MRRVAAAAALLLAGCAARQAPAPALVLDHDLRVLVRSPVVEPQEALPEELRAFLARSLCEGFAARGGERLSCITDDEQRSLLGVLGLRGALAGCGGGDDGCSEAAGEASRVDVYVVPTVHVSSGAGRIEGRLFRDDASGPFAEHEQPFADVEGLAAAARALGYALAGLTTTKSSPLPVGGPVL